MDETSSPTGNEPNQSLKSEQGIHALEAQSLTYSGPLPPSSEMQRYEAITPGAADRILVMAEQQQRHRHEQESKENDANLRIAESNIRAQDANISEIKRGQWMAYSLCAGFIVTTLVLGLNGQEVTASTLGLGGIVALATVFIKVRKKQ
ncbi:Uncharacterized membrane protein [Vreelandella subterranea]|jgi:uncharacterized membrane protein|uniref:Uncharacterized membrane protein n=1 Tax=Vreelandella subterranea TaxID=416874 RepID=A0A1H9RIH7_9GAMM|nr:DUF2335 domain-containing protein [Halomonas subterranea]SER72640.1 Uncharacterized membrane protein [Halomonas subterranea]